MKIPFSSNVWTPGFAWSPWRSPCLVIVALLWLGPASAQADDPKPEPAGDAKEEVADPAKDEDEAETTLTPEQMFEGGDETFENWVEFSVGGLIIRGNRAQAEQRHRLNRGAFGGIEDLHLQHNLDKKTTLVLDGRALFDNHDYKLSLELKREELGFVRFHYENFRTWNNNTGGFYPPAGPPEAWPDDALTLDRGEISFETGLTLKNLPVVTFKYTHRYRDGEKGSTIWGPTRPLLNDPTRVRGIAPAIYDIDERADIFELNATHRIKETDVGLGLRYETGDLDNARKAVIWPDNPDERKITDRQTTTHDLFSVHAFTETWLKKNLFFSTGFLFANLDTDFSGRRVYGDEFDVVFTPNAFNGLGYTNLVGDSQKREYVMNLNLMYLPTKHLTLVPSIRVQREDWNGDASGAGTMQNPASLFSARSDGDSLDVRERLDVRYTGVTNWVLSAAGEWTQGEGDLSERGGLSQIIQRETADERFFQKYSLGARWYAARGISVDLGGYYKLNRYDYDHSVDSTLNNSGNRYPAYLVMQDFETWDGNVRLTLRPFSKLTLVSRYEYQVSTIHTTPDTVSGQREVESAEMTSHIFAQNVSWTPWSRLYVQAGVNYVWSETQTPVSDITQAVLDAQNNYWTLNFNSGLVLDDKTDLNVGYFYYRADNFDDNSTDGLPLGMSAEEHGVTTTLTRRINKNLRLTLRYGYFHYDEESAGGRNDCEAHVVSSSLQYRF
jgi:hypothetical protein